MIPTTSNRALIYARVSTEDQVEKYGLPSQLRACRDYAAANGLTVVGEITDDGVSGTLIDRPGLNKLRDQVSAKAIEVVIIYDVDRLSREPADLLVLEKEIGKKGVRLLFVAATFEDSPSGQLLFGMRGLISRYERQSMMQRMIRGKRERASSGLIVGGRTAYGYRYDAGKLTPHDDQAQVVRQIFGWYEDGLSIRGIALRLRENGTPTWQDCAGWGKTSVRRILANETYAGVAHYGTHYRNEDGLMRVRPSFENRVDLAVPALIDYEQWMRVRSRLSTNIMRNNGRPSSRYLLRGLLYCHCGKRMSGYAKRSESPRYRCNGRDAMRGIDAAICRGTIKAGQVDHAVWNAIAGAFLDATILRGILADRQKELQAPVQVDPKQLREKLTRLQRREKAALTALLDPDLAEGREQIKAEYRSIQRQRQNAEWEVASAERAASALGDTASWLDSTVTLIREYIPTLERTEQRQEFLKGLVSKVEWNGAEDVAIHCLLGSKMDRTSGHSAQFAPFEFVVNARVA